MPLTLSFLSLFFPSLSSLLVNVLLEPTQTTVTPSRVWIVQIKHSKRSFGDVSP